jgi:hypothetical protein
VLRTLTIILPIGGSVLERHHLDRVASVAHYSCGGNGGSVMTVDHEVIVGVGSIPALLKQLLRAHLECFHNLQLIIS